jgi:hypothetical protein
MKLTVTRKDAAFPDCLVVSALHNGHGAKAVIKISAAEGTADEFGHFLVTDLDSAIRAVAGELSDGEGMAMNEAGKLFLYTEAPKEEPRLIALVDAHGNPVVPDATPTKTESLS